MIKNSRILCMVLTLLFSASVNAFASDTTVLATVANKSITVNDFITEYQHLSPSVRELATTPEGKRELLDALITREMLMMEAEREGLDTDLEILSKVKNLRQRIVTTLLLDKKVEIPAKEVSDSEILQYYTQHKDQYTIPEQMKLQHLQVKDQKTAKIIQDKLRSGAEFSSLVSEYSVSATRIYDGEIGWVEVSDLPATIAASVSILKPGQVSEAFQSEDGYQFFRCIDKRQNYLPPLDEIRDQIRANIILEKQKKLYTELKSSLRKRIVSSINEEALKSLDVHE